MLILGIRYDLRRLAYRCARLCRRAAFAVYTRAVGWELSMQEDELSEDLT